MEGFNKFQHFISYFLPGTVVFVILLALMSSIFQVDVLKIFFHSSYFLAVATIGSMILGLLLDVFQHVWIEPILEHRWCSDEELECSDRYWVLNPENYSNLLNEQYYYYEFAAHLFLVGLASLVIIPIYVKIFYSIYFLQVLVLLIIIIGALLPMLFSYAKSSYRDFIGLCNDSYEREFILKTSDLA